MNMRKLGIIISREYLNKVKKKSFLLITFLAPLLFAAMCLLPSLIMFGAKEDTKTVGVVDRSGIVLPYLEDNDVTHYVDLGYLEDNDVTHYVDLGDASVDSLKADLKAAGLDILLSVSELDPETLSVKAECFSEKPLGIDTGSMIENRINDAVEACRIEKSGIANLEEIMAGVKSNVKLHSYTIDESGKESISESGIYMVLSMILGMAIYMFIALFSGMVMSSVIEEKSSRVVEVLVSSVKATELMFGKIIGVALVALTQFLLWILLTGTILGVAMGIMGKDKIMGLMSDDATTEMVQQMATPEGVHMGDTLAVAAGEPTGMDAIVSTIGNLNIPQIGIAFLFFFVFGYLLYASLFAAIGSAVENEGDSSQLQLPIGPRELAGILGIHVPLHLAYRDAGPYSLRRCGLGDNPEHRPPCGYLRGVRMGIGQDLQGGYPHVWQEIYL